MPHTEGMHEDRGGPEAGQVTPGCIAQQNRPGSLQILQALLNLGGDFGTPKQSHQEKQNEDHEHELCT